MTPSVLYRSFVCFSRTFVPPAFLLFACLFTLYLLVIDLLIYLLTLTVSVELMQSVLLSSIVRNSFSQKMSSGLTSCILVVVHDISRSMI